MKEKTKKENSAVSKIKSFFGIFTDNTRKIKKIDWIIMGVLMLIFAVLAFKDLGTLESPQTFFMADQNNAEVTINLTGDKTNVLTMRHFTGPEFGDYQLYTSDDGSNYEYLMDFKQTSVFTWEDLKIDKTFKYLKIVSKQAGSYLGEVQLYDNYGMKLGITAADDQSTLVVDELDTVPGTISYTNSAYFDEIYFARTAYEYTEGLNTNEWVHPPLGKLIQSIPIVVLGMNTFAYRLMGVIAGLLMIPVLYVFAKTLFIDRKYALLAGVLMTFDCFHFAQSRMGTVDGFLVLFSMLSALFMTKYLVMTNKANVKKKIKYLGLSALFIGCAIATKWTGLFVGSALAIIFFAHFIYRNRGKAEMKKEDARKIIIWTIVFFTVIPIVIYLLSYFLFPNLYPYHISSLGDLFKQTGEMFKYHSTLEATHPFTSDWYTWPLMTKPVWYYVGYLSGDLKSTIVGIGNPAIWWVGIPAMLYLVISLSKKKTRKQSNMFILAFIACTWLPYVFIGRVMFMYHFYITLPFIMLAIVAMFKWINEKIKDHSLMIFYIGVVILLFIYFYPVISGQVESSSYIDSLKWFSSWIF